MYDISTVFPPFRGSRRLRHAAVVATLFFAAASAGAASISYTATDLANTTAGEDLWQYSYTLRGPIMAFGSWNLSYADALFAALNVDSSSSADLSPVLTPGLGGSDSLLTITDLLGSTDSSDRGTVVLSFVWKGTGAPGAQAFDLQDDSFTSVGGGTTRLAGSNPVPEPGTAWLLAACTAALALARRSAGQGSRGAR